MNNCFCNTDAGCFKCANSVPNGLSEFSRTRTVTEDRLSSPSDVRRETMNETVTHLGSYDTSVCTDIEPQDMFTHLKASVDCDSCLSVLELGRSNHFSGRRYVVDYDDDKHSWGTVDTSIDRFVGHTTTLAGARVQARRMNQDV